MTSLDDFIEAVRVLDGLHGNALRAWQVVKRTAILPPRPVPPSPPSALGGLYDGARDLADQLATTGTAGDWRTPPRHSTAMEALIHRLTSVLEAFLDFYEGERPSSLLLKHSQPAAVDALYQTSFCDQCGCELNPAGDCPVCEGTS